MQPKIQKSKNAHTYTQTFKIFNKYFELIKTKQLFLLLIEQIGIH